MVINTVSLARFAKQQGLTLIELLISMVIAVVLVLGVTTIYSDSVGQSRINANLAQMDESSRFAMDQMAKDIRMAGFSGCLAYDRKEPQGSFWSVYQKDSDANYVNAVLQGVQGFDATNTDWGQGVDFVSASETGRSINSNVVAYGVPFTAKETQIFNNSVPTSDALRLWSAVQGVDVVTGFPAKDANFANGHNLTVASNPAAPTVTGMADNCGGANLFNAGDIVLFSSCGTRMVAQVCEVSGTQLLFQNGTAGNCNNAFPANKNYSGNANDGGELFKLQDVTYYVGISNFVANQPSLFRGVGGARFELAPGVENMQLLFGYDVDATLGANEKNADVYASMAQLSARNINWNDVVSIRITILVRSPEEVIRPADQVTININGQALTPTDGYLRRVYTRTISLRNRVTGY